MAAKRGADLLIKIGDSSSPVVYTTLGGLRTTSISMSAQAIDITDGEGPDTEQWSAVLEGYGTLSMSVAGSGLFKNVETQQQVQAALLSQELLALQLVVPDFGAFTGLFKVNSYNYSGEYSGALQADVSFQSAGKITWTPE